MLDVAGPAVVADGGRGAPDQPSGGPEGHPLLALGAALADSLGVRDPDAVPPLPEAAALDEVKDVGGRQVQELSRNLNRHPLWLAQRHAGTLRRLAAHRAVIARRPWGAAGLTSGGVERVLVDVMFEAAGEFTT